MDAMRGTRLGVPRAIATSCRPDRRDRRSRPGSIDLFLRGGRQFSRPLLRTPGKHTESLLMRVLAKESLCACRVALSDCLHDRMMAAVRTKQKVERPTISHLIKDDHRGGHKGNEIQPVDKHFQHRGIARDNDDSMKFPIHRPILMFILAIEVPLVE